MSPENLTPHTKAKLPNRETPLSRRYLNVLQQWVPLGVRYFQDWPIRPNCGHFFGGCSWYGSETASTALTLAMVASSPEFDPKLCGASKKTLQEMALKGIRYLCFTHDTGPADCVRPEKGLGRPENCGTKWGERGKGFFRESQCGRYVAKIAIAALLLGDRVDDETWSMIANIHADYADRFADMAPKSGIYTNTQMEENAWTSAGLASVECLLPTHTQAQTWAESARRWMYLTVTTPQDTKNLAPAHSGQTVRQHVGETFTALPDYWTENHGMIHPTYTASCLEFLHMIGVIYSIHGKTVPEQALFNRQQIYDHLKIVADRNGYLHPIQGMDWPYLFADPGTQLHSAAALILKDPDAARIERRALETLERRVAGYGGRIIDPDVVEICHSVQDPLLMIEPAIARPGLTYLLHRILGDGPKPTPEKEMEQKFQGASVYPHAGFAFHRHRTGQTSFSWRNSIMALPLNRDGLCTVAPASNSFLGSIAVRNRPDSQDQVSVHVDQQQHGFAAALVMDRAQASVRQEVLFASLPSGISLCVEQFLCNEPVTVKRLDQGFLRIINENFKRVENNCHGKRTLHTPNGKHTFQGGASPDPNSDHIETFNHPAWLNVDGRLGIVFSGQGQTRYLNRHYFHPWWAIADDLSLSHQDKPFKAKRGDTIGQFTALLAPDRSPTQTRNLSLTVLFARSRAAGLIADGHIALANFEQQSSNISYSCSRKTLSEIPIFEGSTRIGKTRVTYRRHLEAGQALLQKSLLAISTTAELTAIAADGSVSLHNNQNKPATVKTNKKKTLKIPVGGTVWLD
ncbi:MAG: hypothetical protein O2954_00965 [bacterium]|nr:hypothetical protein [bacterium]